MVENKQNLPSANISTRDALQKTGASWLPFLSIGRKSERRELTTKSKQHKIEGNFPYWIFFLCPILRPLSHMRSDEPPAKVFAAKKNYKYTTTAKSLFERLNYTTSWGKLTVKLPSFFLHTPRLLNLNVNKELVTTVGRDSERRERLTTN